MPKPRALSVSKPVRLIFAGGFLGSGKTTALAALARSLIGRNLRVGIITNDQSGNLADTLIVRQMLDNLDVPVEEVVEGCFCCKFDELVNQMEKILAHRPDVLLGEPVGSCTDFVAAVAHPLKIHYRDAFVFAPFTTLAEPDRINELLLATTETTFPPEVPYLFAKQLEEADIIVLSKIDLISEEERERLLDTLSSRFPGKTYLPVSAKKATNIDRWLDILLSRRPGAETVLRAIDYDRYATAEAVLGWLNAAVKLSAPRGVAAQTVLTDLAVMLRDEFRRREAGIGHMKFVLTSGGRSAWINITRLAADPSLSETGLGTLSQGTLIVNARIKMEPRELEEIVRRALADLAHSLKIELSVLDLQCFSPAYPDPPYLMRDV